MNARLPFIPETITVHLGRPESNAENVTVTFLDYIANVASSEIYPTWPESALRANILAEISFALNRFYTEYYRSRGYAFDITNSTAIDQSFIKGRNIFGNIYDLASELFTSYISRVGSVEPLFTSYCDGIRVSCNGLSQWGSVALAEQGRTPFEILQRYYGNGIEIVSGVPVAGMNIPTPVFPLRLGQSGDDVRSVQIRLNRVSNNYPSIPKIAQTDGFFTYDTENAVKAFQRAFNLEVDGIVGRSTWYTLQRIYYAVKKLNDLNSEGISLDEVSKQFPAVLTEGDSGDGVRNLQYYVSFLSSYYNTIPEIVQDGIFGRRTREAVIDAQNTFGLTPDGIVGRQTWDAIYSAYLGIVRKIPLKYVEGVAIPFPGVILRIGSESEDVRILQEYLNYISGTYAEIPAVNPTGYYGNMTRESVIAFQRLAGLRESGITGAVTWDAIANLYADLFSSQTSGAGQYPGYAIGG